MVEIQGKYKVISVKLSTTPKRSARVLYEGAGKTRLEAVCSPCGLVEAAFTAWLNGWPVRITGRAAEVGKTLLLADDAAFEFV